MPTVEPGSKILVSGANGYIAMWVIRKLLEQGYKVRGAVRSAEKGQRLREYFASFGDKFEWVIVEDIVKEGAFDEAVKGVDGIEHMASPLHSPTDNPDDYIVPAVQGTVGILKSALKAGSQIKRIVITSSVAAIVSTVTNPPQTFDESNWGDEFVNTVKEKGKKSSGVEKYRASKTLAEQGAWEFYKKHKSETSWDLVALNPPLVVGPPLQEVQSPAHLNASLEAWFNMIFTEKPDDALKTSHGYIHVEDIAAAHIASLQKQDAGGERIIIAAGSITWQESRNLINKIYPTYYTSGILPLGNPELPKVLGMIFANNKGKKLLGIGYKSVEKIIEDTLADFKARGWLDKRYEAT